LIDPHPQPQKNVLSYREKIHAAIMSQFTKMSGIGKCQQKIEK